MMRQKILIADEKFSALDELLASLRCNRLMLVHGRSMARLDVGAYFDRLSERLSVVHFTDFTPNPDISSVERGAKIFNDEHCDAIVAVGGGSAIDVAKCIKLNADARGVPFLAMPTTAGSGSEATRFAVIYRDGVKTSIEDESILPDAVLFDARVLINLPDYQKKSTLLDAFCHAIESMWSVRANDESRHYAREALRLLVAVKDQYVCGGDLQSCAFVLYAANFAGRAINISKTTAAHAMSYRLTKQFGLAHGHAVARCLVELWQFMLNYAVENERADLLSIFDEISSATACRTAEESIAIFRRILSDWHLDAPIDVEQSIDELAASVNLQRLANNPVELRAEQLKNLYRLIAG